MYFRHGGSSDLSLLLIVVVVMEKRMGQRVTLGTRWRREKLCTNSSRCVGVLRLPLIHIWLFPLIIVPKFSRYTPHPPPCSAAPRSFFQSVCVLGYCVFPLLVSAVLCLVLSVFGFKNLLARLALVVVGFAWATRGVCVVEGGIVRRCVRVRWNSPQKNLSYSPQAVPTAIATLTQR